MLDLAAFLPENLGAIELGVGALAAVAIGAVVYVLFGGDDEAARRKQKVVANERPQAGQKRSAGGVMAMLKEKETPTQQARRRVLEANKKRPGLAARLGQAGLTVEPFVFLAIFAALALAIGGGLLYLQMPIYVAAGAAVVVALLLPNLVIAKLIKRRREAFLAFFPTALDVLIRGVRAGLPTNEGMKVIAEEIPGPVGEEFTRVVAANTVGLPLDDSVGQLADRVPSPDVNFFRTVLMIQKQTGGNLAEVLNNLSDILRERQKLRKKVWALSSEARMSAIIIGSLPIVVSLIVYFMRPDYIGVLLEDPTGQIMLGCAAGWMCIGVLVMRWMIKFDV